MKQGLLTIIGLWLAAAGSASAAIIMQEDFTGDDGVLVRNQSGFSETSGTGTIAWTGSNGFTLANNRARSDSAGSGGHIIAVDLGVDYFINNPGIYELSADVFLSASQNDTSRFYAIGFNNANNTSAGANRTHDENDAYRGSPGMLLRGNGQAVVFTSTGAAAFQSAVGAYAADVEHELRLMLDTTGAAWTASAFIDGTQLDINGAEDGLIHTYTVNPTLRYAGFSSDLRINPDSDPATIEGNVTYLDNFELSVIPEPNALLLGSVALAGCLGLARRRR